MTLNLMANNTEESIIKEYLESNASDILAEKINDGVTVEKDGKTLINKKTLEGFMKYAAEEARKQAAKGTNCACIQDSVVFGWAIHYFEEESIIGTLYNEDGSEYIQPKPAPKEKKNSQSAPPAVQKSPQKETSSQMSLFDFQSEETPSEEAAEVPANEDERLFEKVITPEVKEPEKRQILPLYKDYLDCQKQFPDMIIAIKVGDFYEIYGEAAKTVSDKLNMPLAKRDVGLDEPIQMIGYPYHKADYYCEKIIEFAKLAIVEGKETPKIHIKTEDAPIKINASTGEIEEAPAPEQKKATGLYDPLEDTEFMAKIYRLLGNDIEIVR